MKTLRRFLAAFLLLLIPVWLMAQSEKAQLTGVITDSSGAVTPGVRVTVTNTANGEKRSVTADDSGFYTVPLLEPGKYEVSTAMEGFRSVTRSGIELHVNQTLRADFQIELGSVSESIEVTASQAALQTATSDLGQTVENKQVVDLPLNGRDTIALAVLAPGVRPQGTFGSNPATVNYTGWEFLRKRGAGECERSADRWNSRHDGGLEWGGGNASGGRDARVQGADK